MQDFDRTFGDQLTYKAKVEKLLTILQLHYHNKLQPKADMMRNKRASKGTPPEPTRIIGAMRRRKGFLGMDGGGRGVEEVEFAEGQEWNSPGGGGRGGVVAGGGDDELGGEEGDKVVLGFFFDFPARVTP